VSAVASIRRALVIAAMSTTAVYAQGRTQARSMTITQQGIVATSHTLASQAGAMALARGGSAVDAAIAANAVLAVTEPMMCGIGGDMFMIYREARTGKLHGLNASGWSPRAMSPAFLARAGHKTIPGTGILAVTVPGAVEGWAQAHAKFGRLPWKDLFGAAIAYAEQGYPAPEIIHEYWRGAVARASATPAAKAVFLPGGRAPEVGEVFKNPGLGRALRLIAEQGRDAFYKGDIARAIAAASKKLGGALAGEDLAEFQAEWVTPVSTTYRGWRVFQLPPNGQGIAALTMLNVMETSPPAAEGPHSAAELHKKIEAMKLAYADLVKYTADPRFAKPPVAGLLSMDYARTRAALIDPARANCNVAAGEPAGSDTTYLAAVDREGNVVSWIQSIYLAFGSGVGIEGYGFVLQNRGAGFSLDPRHPNVLAPRKRPFHTIIPGYMERDQMHLAFGIMGGPNQPLAHAQFVSHHADFGMNIQAAMEAPRFTKLTAAGCEAMIETRVPAAAREALRRLGHQLKEVGAYSTEMGRGQAVLHDARRKVNYGASDPRADGSAEPEPVVR
jgi:gamma-glutamyltranspeptidase/glutathione hydrolase